MSWFPGHQPGESGPASIHQVKPEMVGQWTMAIGSFGIAKKASDNCDVIGLHLAFDIEVSHYFTLPLGLAAVREPATSRNIDHGFTQLETVAGGYGLFVATKPPTKKAKPSAKNKRLRLGGKLIDPRRQTAEVSARLIRLYPDAVCELEHRNPYELIAATILSAQCTDVRVNMVTPKLFAKYPDVESLAGANQSDVEEVVRSTGFYQSKARNLIGMAQRVVTHFGGEIPRDLDDLVTLPGVGRKTGNVVRSVAFHLPGLPVDTHVGRLSRRLGLTTEHDPVKVEKELNEFVPGEEQGTFSLRLILHGRRVCDARKPQCQICELADICPSAGKPVTGPTTQRRRRVT